MPPLIFTEKPTLPHFTRLRSLWKRLFSNLAVRFCTASRTAVHMLLFSVAFYSCRRVILLCLLPKSAPTSSKPWKPSSREVSNKGLLKCLSVEAQAKASNLRRDWKLKPEPRHLYYRCPLAIPLWCPVSQPLQGRWKLVKYSWFVPRLHRDVLTRARQLSDLPPVLILSRTIYRSFPFHQAPLPSTYLWTKPSSRCLPRPRRKVGISWDSRGPIGTSAYHQSLGRHRGDWEKWNSCVVHLPTFLVDTFVKWLYTLWLNDVNNKKWFLSVKKRILETRKSQGKSRYLPQHLFFTIREKEVRSVSAQTARACADGTVFGVVHCTFYSTWFSRKKLQPFVRFDCTLRYLFLIPTFVHNILYGIWYFLPFFVK